MRLLLYLGAVVLVVAGLVWVAENLRERRRIGSSRSRGELGGEGGPGGRGGGVSAFLAEEPATLAYGLDRGPGVLRLTPSQLVFLADSGRVVLLDRLDIVGVGATRDLPDRTLARPVLVVTTTAAVVYLAVADPEVWVRRLG